jgi:excinuclease UvrABC nuclease subunit
VPEEIKHLSEANVLREFNGWMVPSCVYFLIHLNTVVYVGQTRSLHVRTKQHFDSGKIYDQVYFLPVPSHQLLRVEKYFIQTLKPKYNLQCTNDHHISHKEILQTPTPQESRIVASLLTP